MQLFTRHRHRILTWLAALCALGVLAGLVAAAGMNLGWLPASATRLAGLVILIGLLVFAGLRLVLEALAARQGEALVAAPEMSTLTFPPDPPRKLGRVK